MPSPQQVIDRLDEIPPLPESTLRLSELIEDPNSTPLSLAHIIEKDISLAARVLRMANSAFYGVAGGVDNLERAVCFLGFSTIQQIAVYLHSRQILDSTGARPPPALWHHAHQTARVAQFLAGELHQPMPQRFYTAGLLHDLGRVALFTLFPDRAAHWPPAGTAATRRLDAERELFGLDHQAAGAHLARRWKYPPLLTAVIAGLHPVSGQERTASLEEAPLLSVVGWADGFSHHQENTGIPGVACAPDPADGARLGLDDEHSGLLQERIRQVLNEAEPDGD